MARSKAPIEFWFDFSSPYAYIASSQIDDIAEEYGRRVQWRPFLLGVIFKMTGNKPLSDQPLKGAYLRHDVDRFSRLYGIPFTFPDPFPIAAQAPSRAFYWLAQQDAELAHRFALEVFDAYYAQGRNISEAEVVADIAAEQGADRAALLAALADPAVKGLLKAACDEAIEKKVCGAPFFFVDGEPFWGSDRLWMVEEWLETGGF